MRFVVLPLVALTALALAACSAAPGESLDSDPAPLKTADGSSRTGGDGSPGSAGNDAGVLGEEQAAPRSGGDAGTEKSGPRKIFVTSATFSGDLIGEAINRQLGGTRPSKVTDAAPMMLKSADALCGLVADSAGLGRGWKAYLSTGAADGVTSQRAVDRLTGNGPWVLTNGTTAFLTKSAFLVSPLVPINITENGAVVAQDNNGVWTGTDGNGNGVDLFHSCGYFSDGNDSRHTPVRGTIGNASLLGAQWQSFESGWDCSDQRHLYCVQEP